MARFEIWLHPANRDWFEAEIQKRHPERIAQPPGVDLYGIPVFYGAHIPERNIEEHWRPTPWGQFAELEETDEPWARPLGLGRIERIDHGPAIFQINLPPRMWG